ncbi:hypothetical protein J1605_002356 [Eschrichtius robustus]|uniref:Uncharacterized protein n=1 Tax=Eschrichtius robustus TaxID=9764 RepID=A0AB34HW37_ESCRO|nr:hypothetical protein J1605_002356 [Eschrichtius robustus]
MATTAVLTYLGPHFAVIGHASSKRTPYEVLHLWAVSAGIILAGLLTLGAVLSAAATVREAGGLMAGPVTAAFPSSRPPQLCTLIRGQGAGSTRVSVPHPSPLLGSGPTAACLLHPNLPPWAPSLDGKPSTAPRGAVALPSRPSGAKTSNRGSPEKGQKKGWGPVCPPPKVSPLGSGEPPGHHHGARTNGPPLPQAFLCFALVFCALVQVAFWRFHNPTQDDSGAAVPDSSCLEVALSSNGHDPGSRTQAPAFTCESPAPGETPRQPPKKLRGQRAGPQRGTGESSPTGPIRPDSLRP